MAAADGRAAVAREAGVVALGWGLLAGHGSGDVDELLRRGEPVWGPLAATGTRAPLPHAAAFVPADAVRAALRGVETRAMDRASQLLTAAAALALRDAGLRVRGPARDRTGLLVGAHQLPWDSADEYWDTLRERGFARASAPAFARIVASAPAGAASRALSLRGPLSVLAEGVGATLRATALAREMLGRRRDVDVLLVGSVFELGRGMLEDVAHRAQVDRLPYPGEVAACIAFARRGFADSHGLTCRADIAGVGLAGPASPARALQQCLKTGRCDPAEVRAVYAAGDRPRLEALENAALEATLGARLPRIRVVRPSAVLGGGESTDAAALVAAGSTLCSAHAGATSAPTLERDTRSASGPILVIAADEVTGAASVLLRAGRP